MGVEGKLCIITGGGSGIGRGAALMMAEQGARIVAVGRTASKVEAVREEIASQGGEALAFGARRGRLRGRSRHGQGSPGRLSDAWTC